MAGCCAVYCFMASVLPQPASPVTAMARLSFFALSSMKPIRSKPLVATVTHAVPSWPVCAAMLRHMSSLIVSQSLFSTLLSVAELMPMLFAALFWLPFCAQ